MNRDGGAVLTVLMPVTGALVLGGIPGSNIEPETVVGGVALMGTWSPVALPSPESSGAAVPP